MFRKKTKIVNSLGDGNCAFNSFALSYFTIENLTAVEHTLAEDESPDVVFADFINAAATKLKLSAQETNWVGVKKNLLELYQRDAIQFQKIVAPLLRTLSIAEARKDADNQIVRTREALLSSFHDYIDRKLNITVSGNQVDDDVYLKHQFIEAEFKKQWKTFNARQYDEYVYLKKLSNRSLIQKQRLRTLEYQLFSEKKEQLFSWWQTRGFNQFLAEMDKDKKWAGQEELFLLARYFRVDLTLSIKRRGLEPVPFPVYINKGSMPRNLLSEDEVKQLADRGVIDRPGDRDVEVKFLLSDRTELERRLDELPGNDIFNSFLLDQSGEVKGRDFEESSGLWAPDCVKELHARDIITYRKKEQHYVFNLNSEDAISRAAAIDRREEIVDFWSKHCKPKPQIVLEQQGAHYDIVQAPVRPVGGPIVPKKVNQEIAKTTALLDNKAIKFDPRTWEQLSQRARTDNKLVSARIDERISSGEYVKYTFFDKKDTAVVTKKMQIELDAEYAKKVFEELNGNIKKRR